MSPTRTTRILTSIGEPSRDLSSETSRRAGIEFVCIIGHNALIRLDFTGQKSERSVMPVSGGCKLHICGGRKLHTRHSLGWAGDLSGES